MLTTLGRALNYCKQGPGHFTPAQLRRAVKKARRDYFDMGVRMSDQGREQAWPLAARHSAEQRAHALNEILVNALKTGHYLTEERARIRGRSADVVITHDQAGAPRAQVVIRPRQDGKTRNV